MPLVQPDLLVEARRAATPMSLSATATPRHCRPKTTIDVILSNCVINLAEDKAAVFSEAFRVLRPGGRLEVNDIVFGGPVLPSLRTSAEGWSECVSGALPEAEYLDLVKQAGFVDVTARRSTSAGQAAGVPVYSVQVSGKKPRAES